MDVLARLGQSPRRRSASARSEDCIGLSVSETSLRVAIPKGAGGGFHCHALEFAPSSLLERPEEVGEALGNLLKEHAVKVRRAAVGVAARWLIVERYEIPPADIQTAGQMVWLRANERAAPELGEMVFDFLQQDQNALVVGMQRKQVERLIAMTAAAGLKLVSIEPMSLALTAVVGQRVDPRLVACVLDDGTELVELSEGAVRSVQHLGRAGGAQAMVSAVRRSDVLQNGGASGRRMMVLWDDVRTDAGLAATLESATGLAVCGVEARWIGTGHGEIPAGCAAAALLVEREDRGRINLLRPRAVAPRRSRLTPPLRWIAAALAAAVLISGAAIADVARLRADVAATDRQLADMAPALNVARPFVDRMNYAQAFRQQSPVFLACLRDVTVSLPANGQTFLTRFELGSNLQGLCTGRSASEQDVIEFSDKLSASARFGEVGRKIEARQVHGGGTELTYSVTFMYRPAR